MFTFFKEIIHCFVFYFIVVFPLWEIVCIFVQLISRVLATVFFYFFVSFFLICMVLIFFN